MSVCTQVILTQRIPTVHSVGVGCERGLQNAAQLVSDDPVDVSERDGFDVQQLTADLVDDVVLVHKDGVWKMVEVRQRQHRVIVLHDHLTGGDKGGNFEKVTEVIISITWMSTNCLALKQFKETID